MTKKDYELIAGILKEIDKDIPSPIPKEDSERIQYYVAQRFSCILQSRNPRFNRSKFLLACGITE